MSSSALTTWHGDRAARVAELLSAHTRIGGVRPGRRVGTRQINWALTLRLAGEFQGFARDLHDLAVDHLVTTLSPTNPALRAMLLASLTRDRDLDKGNAHPGSLGRDFGRLGFELWPALEAKDVRAPRWNSDLSVLNRARNAIAHAQDQKLVQLEGQGYPMQLKTIRQWRRSLDALAGCMDQVVADSLAVLLGTPAPW
jgi:hypothetical protein